MISHDRSVLRPQPSNLYRRSICPAAGPTRQPPITCAKHSPQSKHAPSHGPSKHCTFGGSLASFTAPLRHPSHPECTLISQRKRCRRPPSLAVKAELVDGRQVGSSTDADVSGNILPSSLQLSSNSDISPPKKYFLTKRAVAVGIAADSGCGKSTFMARVASTLSGFDKLKKPKGILDSNSLVGDVTTVLCLDDYHCLDRSGRKAKRVTALNPQAQNFDLMYEQVKALKNGIPVMKPIYNHRTGLLDPPERINLTQFLMIEGLHPFYDERVRELLDFKVYLSVSDDVKFVWKMLRDMKDRGHDADAIRRSIEARRPDFVKYVNPRIDDADIVIKVDLTPGAVSSKDIEELCREHGGTPDPTMAPLPLRVTMEQRLDGTTPFPPVQFMCMDDPLSSSDEPTCSIHVAQSMEMTQTLVNYLGSKPTGNPLVDRNLFALRMSAKACDLPGMQYHKPRSLFALSEFPAHEELCRPSVSLVMDGTLVSTSEIAALERNLIDSGLKYKGELTDLIIRSAFSLGLPGSKDATGLCQMLTAVKVREVCEKVLAAQGMSESEEEEEEEEDSLVA